MLHAPQDRPGLPVRPSVRLAPHLRSVLAPTVTALGLALALSACGKPTAFGEANSLIVVADSALWQQLEQETHAALEPTLFTTRDEKTFHVTHVATGSNELPELVAWKQVLVFGTPESPIIQEIAGATDRESAPTPGDIFQAADVWARGQLAMAIVLEPGDEASSWRAALPEIAETLDRQFRLYATNRMFASGVDTAFARELEERYGVTLRAPRIYHGFIGEDGLIRLRNDRPRPSDRIRSILIERREAGEGEATSGDTSGGDSAEGEAGAPLDPEMIFDWRAGIDSVMYNVPQSIERVPEQVEPERFDLGGAEALQVQGIWHDEGTYPAAGPFIARAVRCPDATWFFDAWLYSPNAEDSKYEFLLQLEEILDSFRCTTE